MSSGTVVLTSTPQSLVEKGEKPRVDFIETARLLDGNLVYPVAAGAGKAARVVAKIERITASDWRQALGSRRSDARLYLSLSEKVGLPLALFGTRGRPHVLVAHHLTSARKKSVQRWTGYLRRFDRIVVVGKTQEDYLLNEVGLPHNRVTRLRHSVDHRFWRPAAPSVSAERFILSVGREQRDYETLFAALREMPDVRAIVVASSPWAREGSVPDGALPGNVILKKGMTFPELRALYADAALVALPLRAGTDYAAGSTAAMEAMAMRKPLVVTATPGIADYVHDGENAAVVPSRDPGALRDAIRRLLDDRSAAERLADRARQTVEDGCNLDAYLQGLIDVVRDARNGSGGGSAR